MMSTGVYLNGRLIGSHNQPELLVRRIRDLRRKGKMDYTTSISYREENNEIQIYTDKGRVLRPVMLVEDGKPLMTDRQVKDLKEDKVKWGDLIKEGVVEYIDSEEEENAYIAVRDYKLEKEHTHLEITPSLILGISAGFAPFPEHNSSPRVTMAAAMAKHEGFRYQPSEELYWKQGQSTEKDFIFTTTQFMTVETLDRIHEQMAEGESLLICCKSFSEACRRRYPGITVRKIPQMLLGRCEFGRDDYSLSIVNMPRDPNEPAFVPVGPPPDAPKSKPKDPNPDQTDMFTTSDQA